MNNNYNYYCRPNRRCPNVTVNKALALLVFPKSLDDFPDDFKQEFSSYVQNEYKKLGCCVLYAVSKSFKELLDQYSINIEKREVVILDDYLISYREYFTAPVDKRIRIYE